MSISANRAYAALVLAALGSGVAITTTKYAPVRFAASDLLLLLVELAIAWIAMGDPARVRIGLTSRIRLPIRDIPR